MTVKLFYLLNTKGKRQVGELTVVGETKTTWKAKNSSEVLFIFRKATGKRIGGDSFSYKMTLISEKEYLELGIEFCQNRLKHNREKVAEYEEQIEKHRDLIVSDDLRLAKLKERLQNVN